MSGQVTAIVTTNLNKIINVNYYPVETARRSNLRHRPIGIGVQGLADTFILLGMARRSKPLCRSFKVIAKCGSKKKLPNVMSSFIVAHKTTRSVIPFSVFPSSPHQGLYLSRCTFQFAHSRSPARRPADEQACSDPSSCPSSTRRSAWQSAGNRSTSRSSRPRERRAAHGRKPRDDGVGSRHRRGYIPTSTTVLPPSLTGFAPFSTVLFGPNPLSQNPGHTANTLNPSPLYHAAWSAVSMFNAALLHWYAVVR